MKKALFNLYLPRVVLGFFAVTILVGCNSKNSSSETESLSLAFNQEMVIGNDTNAPKEELLVNPVQVQTDSKGNIYVADSRRSAINVFDACGNFLRTIGRSGKGPGEFGGRPLFTITKKNELVIMDSRNQRVMHFSTRGELLSTQIPPKEEMIWPDAFRQTAAGNFIMLRKLRSIGDASPTNYRSYLLHLFDDSFENRIASFGHIDSLWTKPRSNFVPIFASSINAGNFTMTNSNEFWYAPGIYSGRIFRFQKSNGRWAPADTTQGRMLVEQAVEIDSDADDAVEIVVYTSEGQVEVNGYVSSKSRGLFRMKDGRMVHFSSQVVRDSTKTVVEVFSSEGIMEGLGSLRAFTFPAKDIGTSTSVLWKYQNDRFYFINNQVEPVVRVGRVMGL